MTSKDLKLMAGEIVKESEYSVSAKKQLLNYIINEASEFQIKSLILDGQIESLEEDAIDIVNKRFDLSLVKSEEQLKEDFNDFINFVKEDLCDMLKEQDHETEMKDQMINFIVNEASDYQVLSMAFERILPDETSNPEKEVSLNEMAQNIIGRKQYKINAIKTQIATLKSGMSKCTKTKNPEKCKLRIEKKIGQLSSRLAGTAKSATQRAEG